VSLETVESGQASCYVDRLQVPRNTLKYRFNWGARSMYEELILDLPFKGDRDYLRLADILPALIELARDRFGPQADVDSLTIRRPFRRGIQVSFEPSVAFSGSFRVRHGRENTPGWLLETERPVTRRIRFDSSLLSAVAVSGPGFAQILEPLPGFTAFDVVVTLMKQVAAQVNRRHWWMCQLNLETPLTGVFPVEVRIRQNLNGQFLLFDIVQAGTAIGSARGILEGVSSQEAIIVPVI
jgi:hypothetical protein